MLDVIAVAAAVIALFSARRFRWLTRSGLALAVVVGGAVWVGVGAPYLILLLVFFGTSSALSRSLDHSGSVVSGSSGAPVHRADRDRVHVGRTGRNGAQVLANGGVAATAALAGLAGLLPGAQFAVAGALAAAMADTWATEIGTAVAWPTRLITSGATVPPGRSGGVSWPGTGAALAATAVLGLTAGALTGDPSALLWLAITASAGMFGGSFDSVLGATLEGQVVWIDNEVVNLFGTGGGAVAGWAVARAIGAA